MGHFLPFQPLDNLENQNFNIEKNTWRYYHFTYIIWWMVPEIWSMTNIIFCHSGPFFALLPSYGPKKSKFSKKNGKNTWRYYHFTKINNSHMIYGSSDMECNGQNVLLFWTISCPFNSVTTQKTKILKKGKKYLEISSFYISVQKIMIR